MVKYDVSIYRYQDEQYSKDLGFPLEIFCGFIKGLTEEQKDSLCAVLTKIDCTYHVDKIGG